MDKEEMLQAWEEFKEEIEVEKAKADKDDDALWWLEECIKWIENQ